MNQVDENGDPPLRVSITTDARIAMMLIGRGADVKAVSNRGETALWWAARKGHNYLVEALVQAGADVNQADNNGVAPIGVAENKAVATLLIERGADVNAVNKLGDSALWQAMQYHRRHAIVEALVQAGADVNKANEKGLTPLVYAANGRHWSIVTTLARSNRLANVDAVNRDGKKALWLALSGDDWLAAGAREAATALICAGADVDFQCGGITLLRSVTQSYDTYKNLSLLLAAGAATAGVSAVDCLEDNMPLMLAAGVAWTDHEIEQELNQRVRTGEGALAEIRRRVPAAKKRIEQAGFAAIRARVLEICIALQEIEMPAPQLIEIVTHTCAPFAARLPYHYLWDAVVLVKHFRSRKAK